MTLTIGTGPFGKEGGDFNFDTGVLKAHTLYFEDCPKRVRAVLPLIAPCGPATEHPRTRCGVTRTRRTSSSR